MKKLFTLLSLLCALNSFAQVTIYSENMGTGSASSVTAYTGWQNVAPIVYTSSTTPAQSDVRTTAVSSGYTGASGGSNIFMSTTSGNARDFVISGINTSSYSNVQLSFGLNTPSITAFVIVEYSTDGTTFTAVPFTNPTATGWSLVSGITLPASATLTVKFSKNNGSQFRLDDVSITGIGAGIPGLTAGPAVTGLTAVTGSASPAISYNLAGTSLTGFPGNISVTPSANLEVSLSSGTGFTAGTLPVPYTTATLASTPIYVRIAAGAPAGALTGATVSNAGGGATTVNVNVSGNVVSAEPTVQTSDIVISAVTDNGLTINWANGNGEARIISYRQTATPAVAPVDGSTYTTTLGGGNTIAYIGAAVGPVTITGLVAGTGYTIQGYEYNGTTAGSTNYLTTTAVNNPVTTTTTGVSPNIQQGFFTSVSTPVYGARSATRVPTVAIGTISGLAPNTTYRYFSTAAAATDFGTATSAGTLVLNDYTNATPSFYTASTGSLTAAGSFGKFTSDASGKFTGTFGYFASSNGRFDAGNQVYVTVTIGEDVSPFTTKYRFALDQAITMLNWGITPTDGSFIKGASSATANNVVALWKSIDGNLVAARPLTMTLVEDNATTTAPVAPYDETAGSWNTIIPNDNPEGIRLIQQFTPTGVVVGCNSDADGTWPSGASTGDPVNGSVVADAIQITITDAPINAGACFGVLPVSLINFSAQKANRDVVLKWSTSQELNTRSFVIERSTDNRTWNTIATVAAAGNSSVTRNYTYTDNVPAKGINYYRLKQVDMDYRAVTSAVRPVLFSEQYAISVAPNPATDFINVYIAKNDQKTTQVIVADINGKVIEKIVTPYQLLSISTSRYAKGVYFVKVITDEQTTTQKVIVQ